MGPTKTRTKSEQARFGAIKEGPCVACHKRGRPSYVPEIHHLLSGGRRRGHRFTVGLCHWHHRAVVDWGCTHEEMREFFGPSLAEGSKPFRVAFGSDDALLVMQDELIGWEGE